MYHYKQNHIEYRDKSPARERSEAHPSIKIVKDEAHQSTTIVKFRDECYEINNHDYYNSTAVAKATTPTLALGLVEIGFTILTTISTAFIATDPTGYWLFKAIGISTITATSAGITSSLQKDLKNVDSNDFRDLYDSARLALDYAAANYFGVASVLNLLGDVINMDHIACAPHA